MERRIASMKEEPGRRRAEDKDGEAEDAIAEIINVDIEMADDDGSDNDDTRARMLIRKCHGHHLPSPSEAGVINC